MNWYKIAETDNQLHGEFNTVSEIIQEIGNSSDPRKLDDIAKKHRENEVQLSILTNPSTWVSTWNWVALNLNQNTSRGNMIQIARSTKAKTNTLAHIAEIALQSGSNDTAARVFIELIENTKTSSATLDWMFTHMKGLRLRGAINTADLRPFALETAASSKNPNISIQILKEIIEYFGDANRALLIPHRGYQDKIVMKAVSKHPAITKTLLKDILQTRLISRLLVYQQALKITRSQLL